MSPTRVISRAIQVGAIGFAVLLSTSAARGEPSTPKGDDGDDARACLTAFKAAQVQEQSGHLVEASQLFLTCGATKCGDHLWQECAASSTRLRSFMPTVVPVAFDEAGEARLDVQVKMDGTLLTSHLDGRALPVDPGTHVFAFSTGGGVFSTQRITIARGQRNLPISASLPASDKSRRQGAIAATKK